MTAFPEHQNALDRLKSQGRLRQLMPRGGHDFASNDYLGLAQSGLMQRAGIAALERGVPVGAGGSRLLRGNSAEHEALEHEAALYFGSEKALFMGGGFVANTAIFAHLPRRQDLVLYDALIHASAHDGMRLGRAKTQSFPHNDLDALEAQINTWRAAGNIGQIWIACESLYSMDGDFAPLDGLAAIARVHEAVLVVDEAHATGLFGEFGRGLAHAHMDVNLLSLHTCGKALGVSGALICGDTVLIETLINRARGFIFATAPSPLNAALVRTALQDLHQNPERRERALLQMAKVHEVAASEYGLTGFASQILPVVIGDDRPTMQLAAQLQRLGYDIRGIRPPTVPRGTARLRISLTLNTCLDTNLHMLDDLSRILKGSSL